MYLSRPGNTCTRNGHIEYVATILVNTFYSRLGETLLAPVIRDRRYSAHGGDISHPPQKSRSRHRLWESCSSEFAFQSLACELVLSV
jgi:hypothetical protein